MIPALQRFIKRIANDVASGKNLEAYFVTVFGFVLIVIDLLDNLSNADGDPAIPDSIKLTALLAAVLLLLFRDTRPEEQEIEMDKVLLDRQAYGPYREFLGDARTLWVYGPSAINVVRDGSFVDSILEKGGSVHILIQNPKHTASMDILTRQLDQIYKLDTDIQQSVDILRRMNRIHPKLEYKFLDYSPGFSMSIVDPDGRNGHLVIEYFGYQNKNIKSRMHINIRRSQSAFWFEYWEQQYRLMWAEALTDEAVFGVQPA